MPHPERNAGPIAPMRRNDEVERILTRWLKERRAPHIQDAIREALAEVHVMTASMMDGSRRRPHFEDEDDVL